MSIRRFFQRHTRTVSHGEIHPDEIFIDAHNLPQFATERSEGIIERSISRVSIIGVGILCAIIGFIFLARLYVLEVHNGASYALRSADNRLRHSIVFADRGVIYDRNNVPLVWNATRQSTQDFSTRVFSDVEGVAHVVGYVQYPKVDAAGFYYSDRFVGQVGAERFFDSYLSGENGVMIVETDSRGRISSQSLFSPPHEGKTLTLAIDAMVTQQLQRSIKSLATKVGFKGGAGVIMDIYTGEVVALTSYPEFSPSLMTQATQTAAIVKLQTDERSPFLNRAVSGIYTPGSIVKPYMALAALKEKIIDPKKEILSTGALSLPNPYSPDKPTIFRDWKAHGWVDMRTALAVSSNVYFFEVGGGFEEQKGLGINAISRYMRMFGFGEEVPGDFFAGETGVVPDPQWKATHFDNEEWRIGDTYNTSIGQYGFQMTPMQAVRAVASIANGGILVNPTIVYRGNDFGLATSTALPFTPGHLAVVQEGMRDGVLIGTAKALNISEVRVAAKTGTAELGSRKEFVNSWVIGYFPYDKPRYAFAVIMEHGPRDNLYGAVLVARELLQWMAVHTPTYIQNED